MGRLNSRGTLITAPEPAELGFGSAPGRTSAKLSGLKLEHLKPGSTITVKCAKGCPAKAFTKRGVSGTVSLARFATRRLKVGTTIRSRSRHRAKSRSR